MAESKGSIFTKSVQKHAGRAKEKLLQNLGKVDRTADEIFDEHLNNYQRQQQNANKLQKEFNTYIRCIRSVQVASKSLMDAISEIYEGQWSGAKALQAQISAIEVLFQDYSHKLGDQVLIPLNTYTAQFPEMRKKIDKRNRKLIDYDGQRHTFQSLQASSGKRKDDIKISKGREQLDEARRTYELLNSELHDELPALYDSRILFLVTNLQTLFASEQVFHSETSKIYAELEAIVDKLATDSQRGSYTFKKLAANTTNSNPSSPPSSPNNVNSISQISNEYPNVVTNGNGINNSESPITVSSSPSPIDQSFEKDLTPTTTKLNKIENDEIVEDNLRIENIDIKNDLQPEDEISIKTNKISTTIVTTIEETQNNTNANPSTINSITSTNNVTTIETDPIKTNDNTNATEPSSLGNYNGNLNESDKESPLSGNNNQMEQLYDIPVGATTTNLPPGVLYRVKATYRYVKEDADELSFDVGEIINVVEYDDPDDQVEEEGWLMGTKENSTEKGLFPANFTRPI